MFSWWVTVDVVRHTTRVIPREYPDGNRLRGTLDERPEPDKLLHWGDYRLDSVTMPAGCSVLERQHYA
jgi:hypothetical protein